ncbi:hypothetical protein EBZ39_00970 [bacterium]|nr:hypothetical protein [bacterium]
MELSDLKKFILGQLTGSAIIEDYWGNDNFSEHVIKTSNWYNEYEKQVFELTESMSLTDYYKLNKTKARDNMHTGKEMCFKIGTGFYKKII